jgi:hypothetical protein
VLRASEREREKERECVCAESEREREMAYSGFDARQERERGGRVSKKSVSYAFASK